MTGRYTNKKKITYMASLGILIVLTVSCAENSTSTITKIDNSDISETTQSGQQPTPQSDTDTVGNNTSIKEELAGNEKEILPIRFKISFLTILISLIASLIKLLKKPVCH